MLFSLLLLIIVGLVGYLHFTYGLFSATLSAILAIFCAIIAIGVNDGIVKALGGKLGDNASAVVLVGVFAIAYSILRIIFDKYISGNVMFPLMIDKIGAGVMGAIAGIAVAGVAAIAAQSMPFGSSILGWQRYDVATDQKVAIMINRGTRGQQYDTVYDLLDAQKFERDEANSPWLAVDDWMIGLTNLASDSNGALANGAPFKDAHPSYLKELFGQRLSLPGSSRRTAPPGALSITEVYTLPELAVRDQERFMAEVAPGAASGGAPIGTRSPTMTPAPPKLRGGKPGQGSASGAATDYGIFVIVRATISSAAADEKTGMVSFTPASVRLCTIVKNAEAVPPHFSYNPIGTLGEARTLYVNEPDDVLFATADKPVEFVFEMPRSALDIASDGKIRLYEDAFLEFKRNARDDLAGRVVAAGPTKANTDIGVIRKPGSMGGMRMGGGAAAPPPAVPTATPAIPAAPAQAALDFEEGLAHTTELPSPINAKGGVLGGDFVVVNEKLTQINLPNAIDIRVMAAEQGMGLQLVRALGAPAGQRTFVVWGRPHGTGEERWAWLGDLGDFSVVDKAGTRYPATGLIVKLKNATANDLLYVQFDPAHVYFPDRKFLSYTPTPADRAHTPTDVGLIFTVPANAEIPSMLLRTDVVKQLGIGAE